MLDIEGNQREVDRRQADLRIVMRYDYDMLGTRIHQASMEAGERWMLNDVAGKPIRAWDSRGHPFRTEYDELRRPLRSFVKGPMRKIPRRKCLVAKHRVRRGASRTTYSSTCDAKPYPSFDSAGLATNEAYDFKGNLLRSTGASCCGLQGRAWTGRPNPAHRRRVVVAAPH